MAACGDELMLPVTQHLADGRVVDRERCAAMPFHDRTHSGGVPSWYDQADEVAHTRSVSILSGSFMRFLIIPNCRPKTLVGTIRFFLFLSHATGDHTVYPDLQRWVSKRMGCPSHEGRKQPRTDAFAAGCRFRSNPKGGGTL